MRSSITVADLKVLVSNQINTMTTAGEVFTAYDVTKALRKDNPGTNILHRDIRLIVDSIFVGAEMDAGYNRDLITLQSGDTAYSYFPAGKQAIDHPFADPNAAQGVVQPTGDDDDDDNSDGNGIVQPPPVDGGQSTTSDGTQTADSEVVEVTKESRIAVPQPLLRKISMTTNSNVYVSLTDDPAKVFVHKGVSGMKQDACLMVNGDGRLRLAARALSNKFNKNYDQYKVEVVGDKIEITPVEPA